MSDNLYPGLGNPPMNCAVCGGTVKQSMCSRHGSPISNRVMLYDKHISIFVLRFMDTPQ